MLADCEPPSQELCVSQSESENPIRAKLRTEIMAVSWSHLVPQFARGALLVLEPHGDLLDVAEAMARDDRVATEAWLSEGCLRRATDDDARRFAEPESPVRFQCVIVQPWVLAQVIAATACSRADPPAST